MRNWNVCLAAATAAVIVVGLSTGERVFSDPAPAQPTTHPAADDANADDVAPGDYCTVLLAPKLRTNLGLSKEQRDKLEDLNTTLQSRLDACADDRNTGPMGLSPGLISGRARYQLAEIGKQVRDDLTPEQQKRLAQLFDDSQLKSIQVSAVVDRDVPRFGPNAGKLYERSGIQLTYTHFGEDNSGQTPANLPRAAGLPPTAGNSDAANRRFHHPHAPSDTNVTPPKQGPQLSLVRMIHLTCGSSVHCLATSIDGKVMVSADDQAVRLWDCSEGHPSESIDLDPRTEHLGRVSALALSPDGRFLAIGSEDKSLRLYSVGPDAFKKLDIEMGHDSKVTSVAFSADGSSVFSAGDDMNVVRWTVGDRMVEKSRIKIDGMFGVKDLAVMPAATVACSCADGGAYVVSFSRDKPAVEASYKEHGQPFDLPMAVSPKDGTLLLAGDRAVLLRGAATASYGTTDDKRTTCVAWSPAGNFFATGQEDGHLTVWDSTGSIRYSSDLPKRINGLAFLPTATSGDLMLAAADDDGAIHLLRLRSGS